MDEEQKRREWGEKYRILRENSPKIDGYLTEAYKIVARARADLEADPNSRFGRDFFEQSEKCAKALQDILWKWTEELSLEEARRTNLDEKLKIE